MRKEEKWKEKVPEDGFFRKA